MKTYKDIDGWFDYESLYIEQVNKAQDGAVFVEIGAYHGKSTVFMGQLIKESRKNIKFYSIEGLYGVRDFIGFARPIQNMHQKSIIDDNLKECGVDKYVNMIYEHSLDAVQHFDDESIDMLLVDGCHSYLDASRDILAYFHKVKWGGELCGHDYHTEHPEVKCAVHDCLPRQCLRLDEPRVWRVKKNPLEIGAPDKPLPSGDHIIIMPYMDGSKFTECIASLKPYWNKLLIIDQKGNCPQGEWNILRPHFKLSFSQLQNWMMWYCLKQGYKYMIYSHEDITLSKYDVVDKLIEAAEKVHLGVVFTVYDTFSLWNLKEVLRAGCYDEQFPFYYTDVDYFNRMRLHNVYFSGIKDHGVSHFGSVLAKTKPQYIKDRMWQETMQSHNKFVEKWGGAPAEESFGRPYNFNR